MSTSLHHNLMAANTSRNLTSHYARLSDSVRRLSTGLRVERAADDAAGLAIRELMRADMASLYQGARNINDAISLIQTADGALGVIDEKLIRMKELAEQAATGTYDSTQRLMIDSEFQQMASEIERIAHATDFNGIHLLDGTLSGAHDGSGLTSTGALKVHFGTANDSAEDYYYVEIGDATLKGLGLRDGVAGGADDFGGVPILSDKLQKGVQAEFISGMVSFGVIPAGSTGVTIRIDDRGQNDDINVFTRDGKHVAGTLPQNWPVIPPPDMAALLTEQNGFLPGATYRQGTLNGIGGEVPYQRVNDNRFTYNGMNFSYSGDSKDDPISGTMLQEERLTIDTVTEDLIFLVAGQGIFRIQADWTAMPKPGDPDAPMVPGNGDIMSIKTQELAQKGIARLNDAIVRKDQIRAHLGAVQNRLENTVTNINIQAENLQSAESRISDADIATEMTAFVRTQILSQSAVSMLAQANSFPHMLMSLIGG